MSSQSTTQNDWDDDAEPTRAERKALRDKVLRVIDHQTTPVQLPGTTENVIYGILTAGCNYDHRTISKTLRATVEHGQVLKWTDNGGGVSRYTVIRGEYADPDTIHRLYQLADDRGAREFAAYAHRRYQEVTDGE